MTENEALGKNLKRLRKKRCCSQEWAANTMEISPVELRTLEHGKANPRLSTLQTLAKYYETTVICLLAPPEE